MNKNYLRSLVVYTLILGNAFAQVPSQLKGTWQIKKTDSDASNMSSMQPCLNCFEGRFLSFEDSEAWISKGRCLKPKYELRTLAFEKIKEDVFKGEDLKDQKARKESFNLSIPATEKVSAIHITCSDKKGSFLSDADAIASDAEEAWLVLRENGELVGETGYGGRYSAARKAEKEAPSFNCAKASSPSEKAICKSSVLGALDKILSKSYAFAIDFSKKQEDKGKCTGLIKKDQSQWMKKRNACKSDEKCIFDEMSSQASLLYSPQSLCPIED